MTVIRNLNRVPEEIRQEEEEKKNNTHTHSTEIWRLWLGSPFLLHRS